MLRLLCDSVLKMVTEQKKKRHESKAYWLHSFFSLACVSRSPSRLLVHRLPALTSSDDSSNNGSIISRSRSRSSSNSRR